MARRHALWSASSLALLLIGGVAIDAGAATLARAPNRTLTKDATMAVRKQGEKQVKKLDKTYARQARALAQHYRRLAQEVRRSGGNVQPLLNAAAYYDGEGRE